MKKALLIITAIIQLIALTSCNNINERIEETSDSITTETKLVIEETTSPPTEETTNELQSAFERFFSVSESIAEEKAIQYEQEKNDFIASCIEYNYKDIARDPNNYIGNHAVFRGEVRDVEEKGLSVRLEVYVTFTPFQGREDGYWDDKIYVEYTRNSEYESRILEDDIITIYGLLNGLKTFSYTYTSDTSMPYILAKYITIEG